MIFNMPQFNLHAPKTQDDMKNIRKNKTSLPIGNIEENFDFSYGYDGKKYYVAEGALEHLVTQKELNFDEAKQLYNALSFIEAFEPSSSVINRNIMYARKNKLTGDDLFWLLVDNI